ncbi:cupin domain-containing protein [Mycolicibacterium sp. CH28]|uniref:cupin domain-containing protein n=1 Tax=Mycolicibacterium sp. CH28 TaxID=2512237 RepID=UPI001081133E|nr:cupin domain-containing protein [Mycolicibacterium sp. CH28]TGD85453.1 cupin domain-containing protein [Mycolicibacterium sp. CH28]
MSSSAEQIAFPSGSRVVSAAAMEADNAADAGGASGALSRGTAAAAGGMWMGVSALPPGHHSVAHHHQGQTTIVCIISGAMRFLVEGPDGEEDFTAGPGQIVVVPGGLVHREENPGDVPCLCVVARNAEEPAVVNVV